MPSPQEEEIESFSVWALVELGTRSLILILLLTTLCMGTLTTEIPLYESMNCHVFIFMVLHILLLLAKQTYKIPSYIRTTLAVFTLIYSLAGMISVILRFMHWESDKEPSTTKPIRSPMLMAVGLFFINPDPTTYIYLEEDLEILRKVGYLRLTAYIFAFVLEIFVFYGSCRADPSNYAEPTIEIHRCRKCQRNQDITVLVMILVLQIIDIALYNERNWGMFLPALAGLAILDIALITLEMYVPVSKASQVYIILYIVLFNFCGCCMLMSLVVHAAFPEFQFLYPVNLFPFHCMSILDTVNAYVRAVVLSAFWFDQLIVFCCWCWA